MLSQQDFRDPCLLAQAREAFRSAFHRLDDENQCPCEELPVFSCLSHHTPMAGTLVEHSGDDGRRDAAAALLRQYSGLGLVHIRLLRRQK